MLPFLEFTVAALVKDVEEKKTSRRNPGALRTIIFLKVLAFTKIVGFSALGGVEKTREQQNGRNE
jgi:hypothetical protein